MKDFVEITIAGETWKVHRLRGLRSIRKMPQVISMFSRLAQAAMESGFPIDKWIKGESVVIKPTEALAAIGFVANALGDSFAEFEKDVVPFLLQRDTRWIGEHGTVLELVNAIVAAVVFHIETSLGDETVDALKNLPAAEEAEDEPVMD